MNNKLFISRIILFIITVLLFSVSLTSLFSLEGLNIVLVGPLLIVLVIVTAIDLVKNKRFANDNKIYNIIFIISHIFILIVLLRGLFDFSITTVRYPHYYVGSTGPEVLFLASNLLYFNIIYISLLVYRLTLKKEK